MKSVLFLTLLVGCGGATFSGKVVDFADKPIEGAVVTVLGSTCQNTTGSDGIYNIPCSKGTYRFAIAQTGYLTEELETIEANEAKTYDLGTTQLINLPKEEGLLIRNKTEYHQLKPGLIERTAGGAGLGQFRNFCVDNSQEPNVFPAGTAQFFDNNSKGWRPFKLDKEGCAYRMKPKSSTSWGATYDEKAEYTEKALTEEMKLVEIVFEPGQEYFIADWDKGFFTKAEEKTRGVFTGYYVKVQ